jgi:chromosome partitioning protein
MSVTRQIDQHLRGDKEGEDRPMPVRTISIINLKGGVGKTTLSVALAEFLAEEFGKKVLAVDIDPQTNLTVSLIPEADWAQRNRAGQTLCQLFKDKLDNTNLFNFDTAIAKGVSNLHGGIRNLHLLPSSIDFVQIQDRLVNIGAGTQYTVAPATVLLSAVGPRLNDYDFVLIDCPPNLGIVTLNALNISDYFLIPVIPDLLSTYGIPQILTRVSEFGRNSARSIQPLGIVISLYREQVPLHRSRLGELQTKAAAGNLPRVFQSVIPNMAAAAAAVDVTTSPNTLRQKYGYGRSHDVYKAVTEELLRYV